VSTQLHVHVQPIGDQAAPVVAVTDGVARITLSEHITDRATVTVSLASLNDPASWLRNFAVRCNNAADDYDHQTKGATR